jgi:hypothetical protein
MEFRSKPGIQTPLQVTPKTNNKNQWKMKGQEVEIAHK